MSESPQDPINLRTSVRMKRLLRLRNVTIEELAAAFERTPATVARWLDEGHRWMGREVYLASRVLHTTVSYLAGETDDPDRPIPDGPMEGAAAARG